MMISYMISEIIFIITYNFMERDSSFYIVLLLLIFELFFCLIGFILSFKYIKIINYAGIFGIIYMTIGLS